MLATILKSKSAATQTTIAIMRTFSQIKHFLLKNATIFVKVFRGR